MGSVGQKLEWKPQTPKWLVLSFPAKAPQDGMTVNPRTGEWSWTPSPWQIGKFDVEIQVSQLQWNRLNGETLALRVNLRFC